MTIRKKEWFSLVGSTWTEKGKTYSQATFSGAPVLNPPDPRSGINEGVNGKIYTIITNNNAKVDAVDAPNPPFTQDETGLKALDTDTKT